MFHTKSTAHYMQVYTQAFKRIAVSVLLVVVIASMLVPAITPSIVYADGEQLGLRNDNTNYSASEFGCSIGSAISNDSSALLGCLSFISYYIMKGAAWIAAVVSVLLNYAIMELVVGMGLLVGNIPGVVIAWQVLRDLVTIFLVFITIYIGIATILNISRYGYKNMLMRVILAALFVNFSSTVAKVIIDLANITGIETYAMLLREHEYSAQKGLDSLCAGPIKTISNDNDCLDNGLSAIFWSKLKMSSMFDKPQKSPSSDQQWEMLIRFVAGIPLFLVLAYAFGAGAIMLIGRFVILIYLIIVSPIGLVAWITGVSSIGSKWWHALINQAVLAPFMLLAWWVALVVTEGLSNRYTINGAPTGADLTSVAGLAIIVNYVLVVGLLILTLNMAKQMGGKTADTALKWGKRAGGFAGGAAAFGAVYGGGYASARIAERYKESMAQGREIDPTTGKPRSWIANRLANTRFDRGMQRVLEAPSKTSLAGWKSYSDHAAAERKAGDERKKDLKATATRANLADALSDVKKYGNQDDPFAQDQDKAKFEAAQKIIRAAKPEDLEWARQNRSADYNNDAVRNLLTRKQALGLAESAGSPEAKRRYENIAYGKERAAISGSVPEINAEQGLTEDQKKQRVEEYRRDIAKNMSVADLKNNAKQIAAEPEILRYVSPENYSKFVADRIENGATGDELQKYNRARFGSIHTNLEEIGKINIDEQGISDTEKEARKTALKAKKDELRKTLAAMDNTDIENMGSAIHDNDIFISSLSQSGYEHLTKTKKGNFTASQVERWKEARKNHFIQALSSNDTDTLKTEINLLGPKNVARLGDTVLQHENMVNYLDTRMLREISRSDVGPNTLEKIRGNIQNQYNTLGIERSINAARQAEEAGAGASGQRGRSRKKDDELARAIFAPNSNEMRVYQLNKFLNGEDRGSFF